MQKAIEGEKQTLTQQREQLMQRLGMLRQQREDIQRSITQCTADLNAVDGALQVCEILLRKIQIQEVDNEEAED